MKEINKHIIQKAITELPVHKADDSVMENILLAIDELDVALLPTQKAPDEAWIGIKKALPTSSMNVFSKRLILALIILLPASWLIVNNSFFENVSDRHETTNYNEEIMTNRPGQNEQKSAKIVTLIEDKGLESVKTNSNVLTEENFHDRKINVKSETNTEREFYKPHKNLQLLPLDMRETKLVNSNDQEVILQKNQNFSELPPFEYCPDIVEKDILIGLNIGYSFLNKKEIPDDVSLKYWIDNDLRGRLTRNRFWLETGIGVNLSSENQMFEYNYLKNEIVNTYEYVDSVNYNPVTGQTIYYTTTVEVWDSIEYRATASNDIKYIYGHIPLKIGYTIIGQNNFSFDFSLGGNYFFKLSEARNNPDLNHENSTIGNIESNTIERKSQFYNLESSLGINWRIKENLIIRIESGINFYDGIYVNHKTKQNAIKLNAGLFFKL